MIKGSTHPTLPHCLQIKAANKSGPSLPTGPNNTINNIQEKKMGVDSSCPSQTCVQQHKTSFNYLTRRNPQGKRKGARPAETLKLKPS